MATLQSYNVNFSGDIDTKTDPFQVAPNNFLGFNNAVRTVGGRLQKRNGFQEIASFSSPYATNLAVFSGGLIGIGQEIQVYSPETGALYTRGLFQPVALSTLSAIRNSATQTSSDLAIAPNGLACVVAADSQAGVIYQIIESTTGNVIQKLQSISGASVARVFVVGPYFVITYYNGTGIFYVAIPYATPTATPTTGTIIATSHSGAYDAYSNAGILYIAWNSTDNSGASYRLNTLNSSLSLGTSTLMTSLVPYQISVAVDSFPMSPLIWVSLSNYNGGTTTNTVTTAYFNSSLVNVLGNTTIYTTNSFSLNILAGLTSIANDGILTAIIGQNFGGGALNLAVSTCTNGGTVTGPVNTINGLFIASKPFFSVTGNLNMLAYYPDAFQPTYFLINVGVASQSAIVAKLAYSNAGAVNSTVYSSPTISNDGNTVQIAYLYKDLIASVNKSNGAEPGGIYNQAGVNIVTFTLNESNIISSEIGGSLQLSGGFLWMYDGEAPVENNFHVWPDPITVTTASSGGFIDSADQPFFYQVTYEWTDASGSIHRSAPSIPVEVSGLTGSTNLVVLTIPSLSLTAKPRSNPVRIVVYRWSTANQEYYQVSSINSTSGANAMLINNPTFFTQQFSDTLGDSSIIGNNLLYTTGGVVEDIGGPASELMCLFDTRIWVVDAEDPDLLWFSKQVIEGTPVEMSDLLTLYIAPTTSSQASTGPTTAIAAMDDKLILFKGNPSYQNAIYYINGTGPDNTGANNQYSQPIFVTSAVGCANQKSIVLTPPGLMFQTSQGIWLLARDLSTTYIGAPMEAYNSFTVTSALSIPNTTQVRFTLNNGVELVYDYFFQKWDTCAPPTAISSVVYEGLHTLLDANGNIWQENPGSYVDGSAPVNQSIITPWYNLAGLQGYIRAYYFYLLGTYLSPHTLTVDIYYDYETTPSQTIVWDPNYTNPNGTTPGGSLEQEKFFFDRQKCQAVKFSITEAFNPAFGGTAGAGLTLSGINFTLGILKSARPTISAEKSAG